MTEELKPCPFCGSRPERAAIPGKVYITCTNHDCPSEPTTFAVPLEAEAIAAWNTRAPVHVKPLVWTAKGYAQTPFGKYLVVREDWSGEEVFWFVVFAGKPYGPCGEHASEEAAKAAAEADYERRILEALE